jgi:hydroxymethylpyrimidine pyrophosphatase-like HAD family hydrolase
MAQPTFEVLGFDVLCVVDNGASIRDVQTGELKWSLWLDKPIVRKVVEILLPYCVEAIDYSPTWNEHTPDRSVELDKVQDDAPYVFTFFPEEHSDVVIRGLAALPNIHYHLDSNGYIIGRPGEKLELMAIQVSHAEATKFHGVESLRVMNGISKDHTLAIGDGDNDLPLFRSAHLKVAMGNATENLKAAADHVVASVQNDGFAEAMQRFVLPQAL